MATVVDALVVTLGLDTTQFRRGQKQASEDFQKTKEDSNRSAKEIEAAGKTAAAFFSKLRNEALMLFAAFTGANTLKQFAENITTSDASMSRLAKQLNMSTDDLTSWTNAIERTGGSTTTAAGTFQMLEDNLQSLRSGQGSALTGYFRSMGIAMLDVSGNARPLKDILLDIAKWAEGQDPAMVSQRLRAMGFDQGTITLLMKGRDAVAGLIQQSKELGVASDADGQRAQALQERWRALEQAATSLGRTILNDLSPMVIDILGKMVQWAQANREWIDTKIGEAIKAVLDRVTELYKYLSTIDWAAVWKQLIEWTTQVQIQFATLFDYLRDHWPEIKQSVSDFADTVKTVATWVDKVVESTVGWGKAAEIFFALWAFSKFAPIIGALSAILGLITGANAGILALAGRLSLLALRIAPFAAMLAFTGFAGGEDQKFSDEKNQEHLKNRGTITGFGRWLRQNLPGWLGGSGLVSQTADTTLSPAQQAFLDTLAKPESGGDYTIKQGGGHFDDFSKFPEGIGPGGVSTASGRYQFISGTWHDLANKLGLQDFSPENQDRAAWHLAQSTYKTKTGNDLEADVKAGKTDQIANALRSVWPSLPGGTQSHQSADEFAGRLAKNLDTMGEKSFPRPTGDPNRVQTPPRNPVGDLSMGAASAPGVQNSATNTTNTNTSEINVNGPITVNTQATDAKGVAAGLLGGLKSSLTVQQANSGLN